MRRPMKRGPFFDVALAIDEKPLRYADTLALRPPRPRARSSPSVAGGATERLDKCAYPLPLLASIGPLGSRLRIRLRHARSSCDRHPSESVLQRPVVGGRRLDAKEGQGSGDEARLPEDSRRSCDGK